MEDLLQLRQEIDEIDQEMVRLFEKRMDVSRRVAEYKIANGKKIPVSYTHLKATPAIIPGTEIPFFQQTAAYIFSGINTEHINAVSYTHLSFRC